MSRKKKRGVAKLLLRTNADYIFSRKRKPGSAKDHHLELIGGKIDDSDETPLAALIREAGEEDTSGTLAAQIRRRRPEVKRITVRGQPHFIFEMMVPNLDLSKLKYDKGESYGFEPVAARIIGDHRELKRNSSKFTSKTVRIFREMGFL